MNDSWWTRLFGRRTVIAYTIVGSVSIGFLYGVIIKGTIIPADDFVKMALLVLGFYFGSRSIEKPQEETQPGPG